MKVIFRSRIQAGPVAPMKKTRSKGMSLPRLTVALHNSSSSSCALTTSSHLGYLPAMSSNLRLRINSFQSLQHPDSHQQLLKSRRRILRSRARKAPISVVHAQRSSKVLARCQSSHSSFLGSHSKSSPMAPSLFIASNAWTLAKLFSVASRRRNRASGLGPRLSSANTPIQGIGPCRQRAGRMCSSFLRKSADIALSCIL